MNAINATSLFNTVRTLASHNPICASAITRGIAAAQRGDNGAILQATREVISADACAQNGYHRELAALACTLTSEHESHAQLEELEKQAAKIAAAIRLTRQAQAGYPAEAERLWEIADRAMKANAMSDGELWDAARTFPDEIADARIASGLRSRIREESWVQAKSTLTTAQLAQAWRELAWGQRGWGRPTMASACEVRAAYYKARADEDGRLNLKALKPEQIARSYNGPASAKSNKGFSDDAALNARRLKACQKAADSKYAKVEWTESRAVTVTEGERCTTLWINTDR